jgi:hypothetical protein
VEGDRAVDRVDRGLVAGPGCGGERRFAPAGARVARDVEAELPGELLVALVVVAAVAAGVSDPAGERERVRGFVKLGGEDVDGAAGEAFAGDQELVDELALAVGGFPPLGREVAEEQPAVP